MALADNSKFELKRKCEFLYFFYRKMKICTEIFFANQTKSLFLSRKLCLARIFLLHSFGKENANCPDDC